MIVIALKYSVSLVMSDILAYRLVISIDLCPNNCAIHDDINSCA